MKTIKQLLITIAVLLCSATTYAYDFEVDGIYYNIISMEDLTVEVARGDVGYSDEVVIPSTVTIQSRTFKVIGINSVAFDYSGITSLTIPNSVTSILEGSFCYCTSLKNLIIEDGETTLLIEGYDGYYNGYFVVYESVFKDCPITNLYLGRKFHCPGPYEPPFKGMNTLETVTIGNGITAIQEEDGNVGGVFLDCINLTDVIIGDGIQVIYAATFKNCKKLKNVTIGNNVEAIHTEAFMGCTSLTNITIGNNVEAIHTGAFMGCTSLTNITIPQSVNLIGDLVFKNTGLISITIPRYVRIIGEDVFSNALSSIYLMSESPFAIPDEECFTNYHYVNTTLYVPVGSIEKYKQAVVWKNFWNIQECDNIGVDDIDESSISLEVMCGGIRLIDAERIPIAIYTINGILVEKIDKYTGEDIFLDKGIYIVSVGNKTMKIKL